VQLLFFNNIQHKNSKCILSHTLKITKGEIAEQIKIKPEKVIIHIPDLDIPYRIKGLNLDEFSITLQKEYKSHGKP